MRIFVERLVCRRGVSAAAPFDSADFTAPLPPLIFQVLSSSGSHLPSTVFPSFDCHVLR